MPPGCSGACRPEKRVTARSNPPQKKWTGLDLPRKPVRNSGTRDPPARARARTRAPRPGRRRHAPRRRGSGSARAPRSACRLIVTANAGRSELGHESPIEGRHRHRPRERSRAAGLRRADDQAMVDEVEVDLAAGRAGVDRRSAEPARSDVERHLPAVIEPRRQREPDLADDLRPQLQRGGAVAPGCEASSGQAAGPPKTFAFIVALPPPAPAATRP